jgi:fimbrial chaperone protein
MRHPFAVLAVASGLLTGPAFAPAAEVQVNPVVVGLSPAARSAIVAVRNQGTETARFELQARSWGQEPTGEMVLAPTDEIAVFPPVLVLAPGEERNVRIGAVAPFGAVEKTFRVFLQEMPPPETPEGGSRIRVLSRIGLPVFLAPGRPVERFKIGAISARGGKASFTLVNEGNVHARPVAVKLAGLGRDGKELFEVDLPAWYVLAGGRRDYEAAIPADACASLAELVATVSFNAERSMRERSQAAGACVP